MMQNPARFRTRAARAVRLATRVLPVLLMLPALAGCNPSGARQPIVSAPLFRPPRGDAEAKQVGILRGVLDARGVGVLLATDGSQRAAPRRAIYPERFAALADPAGERIAFSPDGRAAVVSHDGDPPAMSVSLLRIGADGSLTADGRHVIPPQFRGQETPEGRAVRRLNPADAAAAQWLGDRHLLLAAGDARFLLDMASGEWTAHDARLYDGEARAVREIHAGRRYFIGPGGLYHVEGRSVQGPRGEPRPIFVPPGRPGDASAWTAGFVLWPQRGLQNWRTGALVEPFFADGGAVASPSGVRIAACSRSDRELRIFEVASPQVRSLRLALPEHEALRLAAWAVDERLLIAFIAYPGAMQGGIMSRQPRYSTLLIDTNLQRIYQIHDDAPADFSTTLFRYAAPVLPGGSVAWR